LIGFVVFGAWQIAKLANPKFFYPLDETAKTNVAKLITTINGAVAIVSAVFIVALGLTTNFFETIGIVGTIFSFGSFFDLLKAYNAVK
jgi:fatty acid desaturase